MSRQNTIPPDESDSAPGGRRKRKSVLETIFLRPETPPEEEAQQSSEPSGISKIFKRPVETAQEAPAPIPCAAKFDETKFFWAMQNLPVSEAVKHCMICGCIGSGKTTAIDLLLQSIAPRFLANWHRPEQLVVFDAKCDIVPKLASWGISMKADNVWLLNPFDLRTCVWNVAEAVTEPAMARHFANLIVPEERNSTAPFYWQSAQAVVYAVLLALCRIAPGKWTLRDLLLAMQTRERVEAITARHPGASAIASGVFNDKLHGPGVMATLQNKLVRFSEIAALWHAAPSQRRFDISYFLKKPGVLILGYDPVFNESLWPINAMLLKALTKFILRGDETRLPRHWFVLDEFRAMERVDCIRDLLNMGRSKGAAVTLGLQSIDSLLDVYQENATNSMLEQCTYKTFLRSGGEKTAKWAEGFFSKVRYMEPSQTHTSGPSGNSTSMQYRVTDRSILSTGYFQDLPLPRPGGSFEGVHDVPSMDCFLTTRRSFEQVLSWRTRPANVPATQYNPNLRAQELRPWDESEEARFFSEFAKPGTEDEKSFSSADLPASPKDDDDPTLYSH